MRATSEESSLPILLFLSMYIITYHLSLISGIFISILLTQACGVQSQHGPAMVIVWILYFLTCC